MRSPCGNHARRKRAWREVGVGYHTCCWQADSEMTARRRLYVANGQGISRLSTTTFAARLTDRVAARTLQFRPNFNQVAPTHGAGRSRRGAFLSSLELWQVRVGFVGHVCVRDCVKVLSKSSSRRWFDRLTNVESDVARPPPAMMKDADAISQHCCRSTPTCSRCFLSLFER